MAENTTWSRATVAFASFQAIEGYGYSAMFSASQGHYGLMFAVAGSAIGLALLVELALLWEASPERCTATGAGQPNKGAARPLPTRAQWPSLALNMVLA